VNNLPKVVTQQRRVRASNPRLLDRKSDALPLSHRATHWSEGRRPLGAILHSSDELGEPSQWFCHDDGTINIGICIIIIIIIIILGSDHQSFIQTHSAKNFCTPMPQVAISDSIFVKVSVHVLPSSFFGVAHAPFTCQH